MLHTFDDGERRRFVKSLAAALELGCCYYVLCFSERELREGGPRRVTQAELRAAFGHAPFRVLSIAAAEMAANLAGEGRKAWLARIERVANPLSEGRAPGQGTSTSLPSAGRSMT